MAESSLTDHTTSRPSSYTSLSPPCSPTPSTTKSVSRFFFELTGLLINSPVDITSEMSPWCLSMSKTECPVSSQISSPTYSNQWVALTAVQSLELETQEFIQCLSFPTSQPGLSSGHPHCWPRSKTHQASETFLHGVSVS